MNLQSKSVRGNLAVKWWKHMYFSLGYKEIMITLTWRGACDHWHQIFNTKGSCIGHPGNWWTDAAAFKQNTILCLFYNSLSSTTGLNQVSSASIWNFKPQGCIKVDVELSMARDYNRAVLRDSHLRQVNKTCQSIYIHFTTVNRQTVCIRPGWEQHLRWNSLYYCGNPM